MEATKWLKPSDANVDFRREGEHVKVGEILEMADPMAQIYFLK